MPSHLKLSILFSVVIAGRAMAAEIQLLPQCHPRGDVVLLGDLARIFAANAEQAQSLERMELFPSPPIGTKRYVRVREIQDLLVMRGVNLLEHTLCGSSQIVVSTEVQTEPAARPEQSVSSIERQKAQRLTEEAILKYLQEHVSDREAWKLDVPLDDEQIRRVLAASDASTRLARSSTTGPAIAKTSAVDRRSDNTAGFAIRGGKTPWVGPQQFIACWTSDDGPQELPIAATVSLPPAVVVAVRSLPRGATVQPGDVQLVRSDVPAGNGEALASLEEAVGRETTQAIVAGRPLSRSAVRSPIAVKQGDVVTIYSRSAGVTVRTTGRARDTGSIGDLISVESLLDRKAFFARVSGIQEVEIYARAATAGGNEPGHSSY